MLGPIGFVVLMAFMVGAALWERREAEHAENVRVVEEWRTQLMAASKTQLLHVEISCDVSAAIAAMQDVAESMSKLAGTCAAVSTAIRDFGQAWIAACEAEKRRHRHAVLSRFMAKWN